MKQVRFVCPQGGAKSVIAADWFNRLAATGELPFQATALAGEDPYDRVLEPVASMLAGEGVDVSGFQPRRASPADLSGADLVVALACPIERNGPAVRWDNLPLVSADLPGATSEIRSRVEHLVAMLRVIEAAQASPHPWDLLSWLADRIGPRLSGSLAAASAVDWAVQQFRNWRIDACPEAVVVPHWIRGEERLRICSPIDRVLPVCTLGGSIATAAPIRAPVVAVHSLEELSDSAAGCIVLINRPMNAGMARAQRGFEAYAQVAPLRRSGASHAAAHGAVAMLIRSIGTADYQLPHTGALEYEASMPRIPGASITAEDSDLISRLLAAGERVELELVLTPQTLPDVESANVVAEIRGTSRPEEIVLIGAHLDSWDIASGAIDNGSGVAMVMTTLRLIQELGLSPARTIRGVLFMNEENGLAGGRAYHHAHRHERHVASLETDHGAAAPIGFDTTLVDRPEAVASLCAILERGVFGSLGGRENRLETRPQTGMDTSFWRAEKIPGFALVPDSAHYFDYHHTSADTLDKVNPGELSRCTAAFASLAWTLANA